MLLGRVSGLPLLVVHVTPVGVPQPDYGARHVAALVLMVEPGSWPRIDPGLVATTLGLTPAESQVAVWLTQGKSVRKIALTMGLTDGAIYWHLKQIYQKLPIQRPITSSMMAHMANVPDMAILMPVQTTTIAASPRHSVLRAARTTGPFVR